MSIRHTAANVLFQWLLNAELAGDPTLPAADWKAYVNFRPDTDRCIVATDIAGRLLGRGQSSKTTYSNPGVQIYVRGGPADEQDAAEKIMLIDEALDGLINVTVTKDEDALYTISHVTKTSPVIALGRSPESDRPSFSINVLVNLKRS